MRFATKMVKYWIKNISGNIEAVFFKLGTRNEHHHSSLFWKAFQISSNYFLCHRHFKFLRRSVDGKHLMCFERETSIFKFLRCSVEGTSCTGYHGFFFRSERRGEKIVVKYKERVEWAREWECERRALKEGFRWRREKGLSKEATE